MFSNSKGQISVFFYSLFFIVIVGLIMGAFSPIINDFRIELINDYSYDEKENALFLLVLYALMPTLWIIYIVLSAILLIVIVAQSRSSPI
jgi:hypothetical protein